MVTGAVLRSMPWARVRWALATALGVWLLLTSVYVRFDPVRRKLVREPRTAAQMLSVPLDAAKAINSPRLVLIGRVRNAGSAPLTISLAAGGELLGEVSIAPRATTRIDVAWNRPAVIPSGYRVDLAATRAGWTLEYLELANLHGFTRTGVTILILPAGQQFSGPEWWRLAFIGIGALLLWKEHRLPWPTGVRYGWRIASGGIVLLLLLAGLSANVSPFRIALSPGAFALAMLVLAAPRAAALGRTVVWPAVRPVIAPLSALVRFDVGAGAALVVYAVFLAAHVGAYAGQSDSSGYLNSARLLGQGRVTTPMRVVADVAPEKLPPYAYVPLGFRPHGDRDLTPTYPIGLPLALLAMSWLAGWPAAPGVVIVLHALVGVVLTYFLARAASLPRGWAAVGTVVLATSPLYVMMSLQLMSDVPAMVWTTAAVMGAWHSRRDSRWAAAAGAAAAMAVLVRPTDVFVLAPVAVAVGRSPRRWARFLAGAAPGALVLASYNAAAYGHPFATGYGDASELFRLANLPLAARHYGDWLPAVLTPAVALSCGLPFLVRRSPRLTMMLLLWILSFAALYALYDYTHTTWWYLRFLLPAFPALVVAALLVARGLAGRWPTRLVPRSRPRLAFARATGFVLVASLLVLNNLRWGRVFAVSDSGYGERVYPEVTTWVREHLSTDAAVLAMQGTGALFYYTGVHVVRWDAFRDQSPAPVQLALAARGEPMYAVLWPDETRDFAALFGSAPGSWTQIGSVRDVVIWRHGAGETPPAR